jgi:plasmid maintenance system antidote protein VapI
VLKVAPLRIDRVSWRVALARAGVAQVHVADALGLHPTALSNVVAGRRPVSIELAADLALAVDVNVADLLEDVAA